jgi:hypothetical protein
MIGVRANAKETVEVVARFDQLVSFAGMMLSRSLGVHVRQGLSRADIADPATRVVRQCQVLVDSGELRGQLVVPNAPAAMNLTVDLRAGRVDVSAEIDCPTTGKPTTRLNWLLRQLSDPPEPMFVRPIVARSRRTFASHDWRKHVEDPSRILEIGGDDIRSFRLTISRPAGTMRGQGRGSFVESVLGAVDKFYSEVLQNLKPWSAPAPRVKDEGGVAVVPASESPDRPGDEPITTTELVPVALPDEGEQR